MRLNPLGVSGDCAVAERDGLGEKSLIDIMRACWRLGRIVSTKTAFEYLDEAFDYPAVTKGRIRHSMA